MSAPIIEALKYRLRKSANQQAAGAVSSNVSVPQSNSTQPAAQPQQPNNWQLLGQAAKDTGQQMWQGLKQVPVNAAGYWKDQWSQVGSNLKDAWQGFKADPAGTMRDIGDSAKNFTYQDYKNKLNQDPRWQDALATATTPLSLVNPMLGGAMTGAAYGVATGDPTSVALNAAAAIPAGKFVGAAGKVLPRLADVAKYIPHAAYTYESFRPESGVGLGQAGVNAAMSVAGAKNPILRTAGRIASNPLANPVLGQGANRAINSWVYGE